MVGLLRKMEEEKFRVDGKLQIVVSVLIHTLNRRLVT